MTCSLVWFRRDLRLADNPALAAALKAGRPVIPVYVLDEETPDLRPLGGAARWWLHGSLQALDEALRAAGSRLVLRRGSAERVIAELAAQCRAEAVHWNRLYDGPARERDGRLKQALRQAGRAAHSHKAALLAEPWEVKTGSGQPFKVFTPFWRTCRSRITPEQPLPAPRQLPAPATWPASDLLAGWRLRPRHPDWSTGLAAAWAPGEKAGADRLAAFVDGALGRYQQRRDLPAVHGTSRLSPHLAFGELSPRQVWAAAAPHGSSGAAEKFRAELGWREFAYHLMFHFGDLGTRNFRPEFDSFPWTDDAAGLRAWQRGCTGYPIVDAGMRELWTTGWMHNRVRMIVASFLTKDLLIDWRAGERWFWDTLVDADPANNAAGWQWVAGSGADAQPYFRIFNPVLQGERFDPAGEYVRRWIPELAGLPAEAIHRPWSLDKEAPAGYPPPMVDHGRARARALAAYRSLRQEA
ncbi:MAG: cryptochrome/photolyase family protein [Pseudomonadota bacterium]